MAERSTVGHVGTLLSVHRYPVKSLSGETLAAADLDERGLAGDRAWFVQDHDGKMGSGKSSNRFRRMDGLLALGSRLVGATPVVTFPDGSEHGPSDADAALSAHVGRAVTLAPEADVSAFDDGPVHLVTTASLRSLAAQHGDAVDPIRLRPNLVLDTPDLDGTPEIAWVGREVTIGEAVLRVEMTSQRCVMVGMATRDVPADGALLRTISDCFDVEMGVIASVVRPGPVRVGDSVAVA